jgi:hypothetical protein
MTNYYVDPAAAGANNGASWANAWTNVQSAFDTAVAGDIVYCRGTQTVSTQIDIDTNSGTNASGPIRFIGCNSSGTNDGTRFVMDANGANIDILAPSGPNQIWIENFEVKGSGNGNGINTGAGVGEKWFFNHCSFHDNGASGVRWDTTWRSIFFRCCFYNNTSNGVYCSTTVNAFLFCSMHNNSANGFNAGGTAPGTIIGSLIYKNTLFGVTGFAPASGSAIFLMNTVDSNGGGGVLLDASTTYATFFGNRITNHSGVGIIGLNANSAYMLRAFNYFEGNTIDIANAGIGYDIGLNGAAADLFNQSNTTQGYTSLVLGSQDYNLRSDASMRRTAIPVPIT